jgi:hypothetical protein
MTLFNFVKKNTFLIILFSTIGVLSVFLPWIHYPRLGLIIKGYEGDGVLISIIFAAILFINLYSNWRQGGKNKKRYNIITLVLSLIILVLSIYKIYAFYEDIYSFQSNDPIISYAGAGVNLKYALYVIAALSFVCLFLSSIGSLFTKAKHLIILGLIITIAGGTSYLVYQKMNSYDQLDKIEIEENLNSHFDNMSNALRTKRTDQFVEYIHPILYQSIGGKKKLAELMSELYNDLTVKETKIVKVFKTKTKGDVIQALLLQSITFVSGMEETTTNNKSFAFSYDGGNTWIFAGIENRTFDEMKKILPELFEELRYS